MWPFKKKEIRFCKDCVYFIEGVKKCANDKAAKDISPSFLVNGLSSASYAYCYIMRLNTYPCGKKGKLWKRKPVKENS